MAGEVRSQLTITLQGGAGGVVAGGSQAPVSRRADLLSPQQSVSNFAAERQLRWSRVLAMDIARDRDAMRALEQSRLRSQVRHEALEISSAVRAAEERIRRRASLAERIRSRSALDDDDTFGGGSVGRRALRSGAAASRRILRGMATGAIAEFGSQILTSDDGGTIGVISRISGATLSGGVWGGAPGAVGAFVAASISEITRRIGDADKELEEFRKAIARTGRELRQLIVDSEQRMRDFEEERQKQFEVDINRIISERANSAYREQRYHRSELVS